MWATWHFRFEHWREYFGILSSQCNGKLERKIAKVERARSGRVISWEEQERKRIKSSSESPFSANRWITLEDVDLDVPISSDEKILASLLHPSMLMHYMAGPIMIQRFIVVREGGKHCLCVGIHTYVRLAFPEDYFPADLSKVRTAGLR